MGIVLNASEKQSAVAVVLLGFAGYKIAAGTPPNFDAGECLYIDKDLKLFCSTGIVKDEYLHNAETMTYPQMRAMLIKQVADKIMGPEKQEQPQDGPVNIAAENHEDVVEAHLHAHDGVITRDLCLACAQQAVSGSKKHIDMFREEGTMRILLASFCDANTDEQHAMDRGTEIHKIIERAIRGA